jgi:two-component system sensor histidine kinase/response regulator
MSKILVIEDDNVIRDRVVDFLSLIMDGYEILSAENGLIGIGMAKEHLPALIISDMMMPEKNGLEVLQTLRAFPATSTIPFLFLTARTDKADIRQGMTAGADDYLTKPFSLDELEQAVHVQLEKRQKVQEKSEEKIEALRQNLSRSLPHELLTPLIGIMGNADMLAQGADAGILDPEDIKDLAKQIRQSGDRLHRIITNFILYSRLEVIYTDRDQSAYFRTLSTEYANVPILDSVMHVAMKHDRQKNVEHQFADVNLAISGEFLDALIREVAKNAFEYSEPNTPLHCTGVVNGDTYYIIITDKGRGMSAEQIKSIGAYMQFDRMIYEQQGAGLGLAIIRRIVDIHQGILEIQSTPGEGTSVLIHLPVASS